MRGEKLASLSVSQAPEQARNELRSKRRRQKATSTSSQTAGTETKVPTPPPLHQFLRSADNKGISQRFTEEAQSCLSRLGDDYCILGLLDAETPIENFDLDRIFAALQRQNPDRNKDVLLFLLTRGGSIEPAYQMSKICKNFARGRFVVAVPRFAKSAGTLLALGADEIHMGPLGHLGPIDPQIGGLPALGVSQALKSIASVSEQYPGSSEMFSLYLKHALTVEQIGYCERVSESAAQYAERLLQTKVKLPQTAKSIANELVHEYKDHGFVIDLDEAQQHLGTDWVKTGTPETVVADLIYDLFETMNLFLGLYQTKRLLLSGGFFPSDVLVVERPKR